MWKLGPLTGKALPEIIEATGNLENIQKRYEKSQKRIVTTAKGEMKINKPTQDEMLTLMNGTYIGVVLLDSIINKWDYSVAYGTFYWAKLNVPDVKEWNPITNLPDIDRIGI